MLEYLVNSMVDDGVPSAVVYSEVIRTLLARALRLVYDTAHVHIESLPTACALFSS